MAGSDSFLPRSLSREQPAQRGRTKGCHPCAPPQLHKAWIGAVISTTVMPTLSLLVCTSLHYLIASCCGHFTSFHTAKLPGVRNPFLRACRPLQPLLWRVFVAVWGKFKGGRRFMSSAVVQFGLCWSHCLH